MNPTLRVKLVANKARYNGNRYPIGTEIEVTQSERDKRKFFFPRKDYYVTEKTLRYSENRITKVVVE